MATVVLTPNNKLVKIIGNDKSSGQPINYSLDDMTFEMDGTLTKFTVNNKSFIFIYDSMYHSVDKDKSRNGFCLKSEYSDYNNHGYLIGGTLINELLNENNWFDDHFELAEKGDIFNIEKVETSPDNFQKYYTRKRYSFEISDFDIDFYDSKQYPLNTNAEDLSVDRLNEPDGLFFQKNFKNKIGQLNISESAKIILYKGIIKICFQMYWVVQDILEILAIKNLQGIIDFINSGSSDIIETIKNSNLTTIDKTIAYLLLDFGYRDIENTLELAPILENDQFYGGLYQPFENYLNALSNVHRNLYLKNEEELFGVDSDPSTWSPELLEEQSKKRMKYIKDILPASAISLIFQFEEVKDIFDDYIKRNFMGQHQEGIALKIIYSLYLNPKEGEKFLDYLLEMSDNIHTNFEKLYHLFDDEVGKSSLGMFSGIYDFFAQEKPNRRNFVFAIFKIWENSKYNFYYQGDGELNGDGINLQSYFFTPEGKEFFTIDDDLRSRLVFEFDAFQTNTWENYEGIQGDKLVQNINYTYYANKNLFGKLIKIEKITTYDYYIISNLGSTYDTPSKDGRDTYKFNVHLYQPMFILGYTGDLELQPIISEYPYIPAFLFYYYQDFDKLKDIHAGISFAVDVVFEVGLFFLTGGASTFSKIRYLKYFTEIGNAIRTGSTTANTALIIKGIEGVTDSMAVTSSVCGSYYNFMANTANTETAAKQYEETSQMFFTLTLYAAGASMITRYAAGRFAQKALEKPNFGTLPEDVQNFVNEIAGIDNAALNIFRSNRLANKPNIAAAFDNWQPSIKRQFFEDFGNLSEIDLVKLDVEDALNNWKKLLDNNITDRVIINVTTSTKKTNNILRYYTEPALRNILEALDFNKRWKFLNNFTNVDQITFNRIKTYPECMDVFWGHTPSAQKLLGENAELWLKYFEARMPLKNKQYSELSGLFEKEIGESTVVDGIKYVTDGDYDVEDIRDAIAIANRTDDVQIISEKLAIPYEILSLAKKHYYIDEQFIFVNDQFKIGRFERTFFDNQEWLDIINKSVNELGNEQILMFKRLIVHEYVEAKLMDKGVNFRSYIDSENYEIFDFGAHDISPRINDSKYVDMKRTMAPPYVDIENLTNLDQIVNWYINFYKL
ncbi:MAG: hypothetical protein LBE36_13995 [Flavobacteriaceae bacterium]|jgi:hypothetical protein|nr:hypothetical protein [Flavobacteriaceae bacterium]